MPTRNKHANKLSYDTTSSAGSNINAAARGTMQLVHDKCISFFLLQLLLLLTCTESAAFIVPSTTTSQQLRSARSYHQDHEDSHFLLQEFSIASGEVINPYDVLKVSRKSAREEIRASYIKLSRRYHPDGYRNGKGNNNILPGSCNNLDDVRDQWERIKLSYEILSNPKSRKRYDRHDVLSDPNAAMKRAMANAAFDGITNVGKGLFDIGSFAVHAIRKVSDNNVQKPD